MPVSGAPTGSAAAGKPPAAPPAPPPAAKPPAAGAGDKGGGAAPGAAPGAGANPNDPDPMASVKQASKEIEFKPKGAGTLVNFNLDDADLPDLVKAISNITGRRFIYGGKLHTVKATVYSPEKVTAGEAYAAFLSILQQNGMTVVPHGRFLKIIDSQGVASEATPLYGPANPVPGEERYVTRMYRVQHVDANEVATLLGKFKSKDADISVYPPGNLIIITDTGAQIQRMLRIVEEVDVGGAGDQLWVEPIHHAGAGDVANKLNEILDLKGGAGGAGGKGGKGGAKIVPDDRTNSLIMTATQPDYLRLLELIKRMDVPQSGEGEIHVLPLQYAGCKDLSTTLNSILGRGAAGGIGGTTGAAGATRATRPGGAGGPPVPGSTEDIFEGQVKVVCDEASNKLVITSSLRDFAQLRTVIDQLDMPRRQVFIEAVIMDVNVDRALNLGVAYHAGAPVASVENPNDTFLYGGNNLPVSVAGLPAADQLEGLAIGLRGPTIPQLNTLFPGLSIPAFGVVINALGKDGNSNVLATPHILATDNIPAQISIGQNIPLQVNAPSLGSLGGLVGGAGAAGGLGALGALGGLGGLGGFGGGRQDVGTKIKVTPHVNDSDQVRLELDEEISEAGAQLGSLGAIPINKRTAETTLIVRDQQTVVIGGLVRDSMVEAQTKIPLLGDLPVLGALFRHSTKTIQKTNLLLILTPYIVRNQDDLRAIFERKMQERQEFIDRYLVFADDHEWSPPRDFARANGLVEDIRQSIIEEEDKLRRFNDSKPKFKPGHEPGEPIPVPQLGAKGSSSAAAGTGGDDSGGGTPANAGTPRPPVSRPKASPQPKVDRVE